MTHKGLPLDTEEREILQRAIIAYQEKTPQDRTFQLTINNGQQLWIKTPSKPRLRWLYTVTNHLMVWANMPYFQAPPHAGGPGGTASLNIEKKMLLHLRQAGIPAPEVVASSTTWLALSTVGYKNLDEQLKSLEDNQRLSLWQQAVEAIAHVHAQNCFLSQCFARNMLIDEIPNNDSSGLEYKIYFLDFEENPTAVMTPAQAQIRDWAFFLHSTACLIAPNMEKAQQFLLQHLYQENPKTQQAAQHLFRQLSRLRWLKKLQWLGRDSIRLYHLGTFSQGIYKQISRKKYS